MNDLKEFQSFAKRNKKIIAKNNKAVIYTRVSGAKQVENTSLETQKKECTQYALNNNLEIYGYFGGTHESAKNDERKEYKRMLAYVKQNKIANIIVYTVDRFSRSGGNAIATVENLNKKGIRVLSVRQPADTDTSSGVFFQNINLIFSKYDNDQRREKSMSGMRQRLLNGYYIGVAPFGYVNARNENNIPILKKGDKAKWVRKAFEWKANEHLSNVEIINRLRTYGVKLYKQKLTRIFKNPIYCGLLAHNLLDGEIIEGKHPKIVSKELFLKVNGIQANNNKNYKQNKLNDNLPLKGFTKCDKCGNPMTGYIVKAKGLYYYKCKTIGCKNNKSTKQLHEQFEQLLGRYQIGEKYIAPLLQQMRYTFEYFTKPNKENVATLKYNLKTINEKIEKIEERFVMGEIDMALYQKFVKKFTEEKETINAEIKKMSFESSNLEKYLEKSLRLICNLHKTWELSDYVGKQKLQNTLFPDGIRYNREKDQVRTNRVNMILELTCSLKAVYNNNKKGTNSKKLNLSHSVAGTGLEPVTLQA